MQCNLGNKKKFLHFIFGRKTQYYVPQIYENGNSRRFFKLTLKKNYYTTTNLIFESHMKIVISGRTRLVYNNYLLVTYSVSKVEMIIIIKKSLKAFSF